MIKIFKIAWWLLTMYVYLESLFYLSLWTLAEYWNIAVSMAGCRHKERDGVIPIAKRQKEREGWQLSCLWVHREPASLLLSRYCWLGQSQGPEQCWCVTWTWRRSGLTLFFQRRCVANYTSFLQGLLLALLALQDYSVYQVFLPSKRCVNTAWLGCATQRKCLVK